MGLLRWLKKNNKSQTTTLSANKRRQSEPPMPINYHFDPNSNRESYLKAFEEFQERRHHGHRSHECCRHQQNCDDDERTTMMNGEPSPKTNNHEIYSTVVKSTDAQNVRMLVLNTSSTASSSTDLSGLRGQDLGSYLKEKHHQPSISRNSLPTKMPKANHKKSSGSASSKKANKKKKRNQQTTTNNNNSTIYENDVKEFEIRHCNNNTSCRLDPDALAFNLNSPPSQFFRSNINPFASPLLAKRTNEHFQQGCLSSKSKNNHWTTNSSGESNFNGSYKRYELNAASSVSTHNVAEEDDGGGEPRLHHRSVASDSNSSSGEEDGSSSGICSGASSSEPLNKPKHPNAVLDHQNRNGHRSFRYEHEVNKYGDLVEYAMPQVIANDEAVVALCVEERPIVHPSNHHQTAGTRDAGDNHHHLSGLIDYSASDEVFVDKSFEFLNECQTSAVLSSHLPKSVATTPKTTTTSTVRVTDLDESTDVNLTGNGSASNGKHAKFDAIRNEMCQELSFLENWSESLRQRNTSTECLEKYKSNVALCKPRDIKYTRNTSFGNRYHTQLDFSCGTYRKASVTLRKCNPRIPEAVRLVEEAIEKDYDILRSEIKHPNIVMLMAACYNKKLINHMILVLEPCDFTLNYFLHTMDGHLTTVEAIALVQQIASATQYLHQFGFVHSNISSHCVLMGNQRSGHALNVKLSSFELTTVIHSDDIRRVIDARYDMSVKSMEAARTGQPPVNTFDEDCHQSTKDAYSEKSKKPVASLVQPNKDHSYLEVSSEFLSYNTNFRQHLSLFNYQAPELLTTYQDFVFPTVAVDVYALTLLLWEILNENVPYVVYSKHELQCLFLKGEMFLPILEKQRCSSLVELLSAGLEIEPCKRKMSVDDFLDNLVCAKAKTDRGEVQLLDASHSAAPLYENSLKVSTFNESRPPRTTPKKTIVEKPLPPIPMDEATVALLRSKAIHTSNSSALNKMSSSSLADFNQALNNPEDKIRTSTLKRRKPNAVPPVGGSKRAAASLFQSDNNAVRRSTIKRLPDISSENVESDDKTKLQTKQVYPNKRSQPQESAETPQTRQQNSQNVSTKSLLSTEKSKFLNELLLGPDTPDEGSAKKQHKSTLVSRSVNSLLDEPFSSPDRRENPKNRRNLHKSLIYSAPPPGYRFEIGEFVLPSTPIARENKIRRNAWLSDQKLSLPDSLSDSDSTGDQHTEERIERDKKPPQMKCIQNTAPSDDVGTIENVKSPIEKKINVSIRIVHSKISPTPKSDISDKSGPSVDLISPRPNGWTFGKNRRKSSDQSISEEFASPFQFVCRKPTKLVYSESMLKKDDEPSNNNNTNNTMGNPSTKDTSAEFNTYARSCSTDNVTQDFQKIVSDLDMTKKSSVSETLNKTSKSVIATQMGDKTNKPQRLRSQSSSTPIYMISDGTDTDKDAAGVVPATRRQFTPVKDTILQFENWLALNKTNSPLLANSPMSSKIRNGAAQQDGMGITPSPSNHQTVGAGETIRTNVLQLPATSAAVQQHMSSVRQQCSRSNSTSSNQGQTVIKRTIFTESIVSGVDLDSIHAANGTPIVATPTEVGTSSSVPRRESANRKQLTTCVTLNMRQTRRRQSIDGSAAQLANLLQHDVRHTMCGNEIKALVKSGAASAGGGSSSALCVPSAGGYEVMDVVGGKRTPGRKYVCCNCAETIPRDQLKALTLPSGTSSHHETRLSDIFKTPLQRCLMGASRQTMRSTEDFYIDDDFTAGMGANMELVSDTSDLFDIADFNDDD